MQQSDLIVVTSKRARLVLFGPSIASILLPFAARIG